MLTDHKIRQEMYHKLEKIEDLIEDKDYIVLDEWDNDLIDRIVDYFQEPFEDLIYPAKSYSVAIIYACLLEQHFDILFIDSLNDSDLFAGTDKFFVPFDNAEHIYTETLEYLNSFRLIYPFNENLPQITSTIDFFKKEFFLYPNPYFNNIDLV